MSKLTVKQILQTIKNFIGSCLLGYAHCYLCGNTLWREDTGTYGDVLICSKCREREDVLIKNLATRFYVDPQHGRLRGVTVYCPSCKSYTTYWYEFEEGREYPIGAHCGKCGKHVELNI